METMVVVVMFPTLGLTAAGDICRSSTVGHDGCHAAARTLRLAAFSGLRVGQAARAELARPGRGIDRSMAMGAGLCSQPLRRRPATMTRSTGWYDSREMPGVPYFWCKFHWELQQIFL